MIKEKKPEKIILDLSYVVDIHSIKEKISRCNIPCLGKWEEDEKSRNSEMVLYITDLSAKASKYKAANRAVLVYLHEGNKSESFPENRYFIEGFEDVDDTYFIRIYQREKKIPCTIAETERLRIREMTPEDTKGLYCLYEDKTVVEFMDDLPQNREEEKEYIAEYIDKVYGFFGFGMWLVELKETGALIGRVGFQNYECAENREDTVELGFMIAPKFQRRGYAYEACKAAIAYMQEEFPEYRRIARCKKENVRGIQLCKKLEIECWLL